MSKNPHHRFINLKYLNIYSYFTHILIFLCSIAIIENFKLNFNTIHNEQNTI
jgi:uncharacterized protein (DUF2225 family)